MIVYIIALVNWPLLFLKPVLGYGHQVELYCLPSLMSPEEMRA